MRERTDVIASKVQKWTVSNVTRGGQMNSDLKKKEEILSFVLVVKCTRPHWSHTNTGIQNTEEAWRKKLKNEGMELIVRSSENLLSDIGGT